MEYLPKKRRWRWRTGRRITRCRWWLSFTTGYAAIDSTPSRKKRTAQKRGTTSGTTKACFCRVPMLTFVRHLTLINAYRFAAAVAIFGKGGIETTKTIWSSFPHNVPLTAELQTFHWYVKFYLNVAFTISLSKVSFFFFLNEVKKKIGRKQCSFFLKASKS